MSMNVAKQLVHTLSTAGVRHIYGIVGDSLNSIVAAMEEEPSIRWVHVRHEESAAFAAAAEAQLTGELAACCGSCGPGNLHLINGLYEAKRNAAPVFALASHIPSALIGSDYFQETHPTLLFQDCSCYCELVSQAAQAQPIIHAAIRHAQQDQGVGMVVLPGDIAQQNVSSAPKSSSPPIPQPQLRAPLAQIEQLADLISQHARICFLCGLGCTGAAEDIAALSAAIKAPIVYSLRGKDIIEGTSPNTIGMTGLLGWGDAYEAIQECDLLIIWGSDFPYSIFLPQGKTIVQIDHDARAIGRRCHVDLGICAEVKSTAQSLLPHIKSIRNEEFLDECLKRHEQKVEKLHSYAHGEEPESLIRPEYITKLVSDHADEDAIFIVDTGTPNVWAARHLDGRGQRRIIGSFKHGSMACGLAMSIGAKMAFPDRQVIVLCGDGSLSMLPGDLLTLIQEKLRVHLLVYNNSSLELVDREQRVVGMSPAGTQLMDTDYAKIAASMGLAAERIRYSLQASEAVERWLSSSTASLLDVCVDPHALIVPPDISLMQRYGFGKSLLNELRQGNLSTVAKLLYGNKDIIL